MKIVKKKKPEKLARVLGKRIAKTLAKALKKKGFATLAVSGGSTPVPLFDYLSKKKLDWASVTVTLVDERCVEPDSEQSNARLVREHLLQNRAAAATFIPLHAHHVPLEESLKLADRAMAILPKFDCVILGMGTDGHTASIFPQASNRDEALNLDNPQNALLVDPVTAEPLRITQSARRLLYTDQIFLHITGAEKATLLKQVLAEPDAQKWPVAFFLSQTQTPISLYKDRSNEQETRK